MTKRGANLNLYRKKAVTTGVRKRWRTRVTWALVLLATFIAGQYFPGPMRLPTPHTTVIAYTSTGVHVAFLDSAGEFRNAETGEQIAQVTRWTTP